jgi:hypothetical protein
MSAKNSSLISFIRVRAYGDILLSLERLSPFRPSQVGPIPSPPVSKSD